MQDQAILNLVSAEWASPKKLQVPGTQGQKNTLWFCYLYLHLINNTLGFTELSASTIFFPKGDLFLQISVEGLKSGRLLQFSVTHNCQRKRLTWSKSLTVPFHFPKEMPADSARVIDIPSSYYLLFCINCCSCYATLCTKIIIPTLLWFSIAFTIDVQ